MVGGPFSGDTLEDIERNIVATELLGIEVVRVGGACVVPNSMGRAVLAAKDAPGYAVWMEVTKAILAGCAALIVTPDWKRSSGTRTEVDEAVRLGIPVFFDIPSLAAWLALPDYPSDVSPVTTQRLRRIRAGLSLQEPKTAQECEQQLEVVRDALRAVQSLDDLGEAGNQRAAQDEQTLFTKYDTLIADRVW